MIIAAMMQAVALFNPNVPHTLVVSSRNGIVQIPYRDGDRCMSAKLAIEVQQQRPPVKGVIYGAPAIQAVCVPRL